MPAAGARHAFRASDGPIGMSRTNIGAPARLGRDAATPTDDGLDVAHHTLGRSAAHDRGRLSVLAGSVVVHPSKEVYSNVGRVPASLESGVRSVSG